MPLRLIFMGTPDFAVPTLVEIVGGGHDVVAVYTRAPKPAGRGMDLQPTPVQREAGRFGFDVLTPATLRTPEAQDRVVSWQIEEALPPIQADREALSRAFWNLLENAAKYSPAGSPIRVTARRQGNSVLLAVEDQGAGIPGAERKRIFQKFERGAEAKRAGVRGVGIGLALVQRIVEAHGGTVRLESEPGQGSTFTLVLPCPGF